MIFTADERFEGGRTVLEALQKHGIKASFFLTGNCLRDPQWKDLIRDIIRQGHYVGPHGDRHLLYAPWDGDTEKSLVSADSLRRDIADNLKELSDAGVDISEVSWFMPSYEHFNTETVRVAASMGLELLHLTPGILTRADYTTPEMPSYSSSRELLKQLYDFEKEHGLQGAVLLVHPGTEFSRTDKLYDSLDGMIRRLERKGYVFERLP